MLRSSTLTLTLTLTLLLSFAAYSQQGTYHYTAYSCGFSVNIWRQYRLMVNKDSTFTYEKFIYESPTRPRLPKYKKPRLEEYVSTFGKWTMNGDTLVLKSIYYTEDFFDRDLVFSKGKLYADSFRSRIPFHKEIFPGSKKRIKRKQWQKTDNIGKRVIRKDPFN